MIKGALTTLVLFYALNVWYFSGIPHDPLIEFNSKSSQILSQLMQTKYFRLIRLNLQSECPLKHTKNICKKEGCSVCRCRRDQIPQCWEDKVVRKKENLDLWGSERGEGIWHVQDLENDKGQYFDIQANVQGYTGYNGSDIWRIIYEENCFEYNTQCSSLFSSQNISKHQQFLYKLMSGLHTSISTQLSQYYTSNNFLFRENKYQFNGEEYQNRVLKHQDRINNLFFLHQLFCLSLSQITKYLKQQFQIQSDNIHEDLRASSLLKDILNLIEEEKMAANQVLSVLQREKIKNGKIIQPYIHNISRIINCIGCEKCRLFGKMQTYGLGTALKILFDKKNNMKRNQIVALFNTFAKITMSVRSYYTHRSSNAILPHMKMNALLINIWLFISGALVLLTIIILFVRRSIGRSTKEKQSSKKYFQHKQQEIKKVK